VSSKPSSRNLSQLLDDIGPIGRRSRRDLIPSRSQDTEQSEALALDVRRLSLLGVLRNSRMGQLLWGSTNRQNRPMALYSLRDGALTIHEIVRDGRLEQIDEAVKVEMRDIFSGAGARPWLRCPHKKGTGNCGRRAMVLFLLAGETQFQCRSCAGRDSELRINQLASATSHAFGDATA
jgi:hypothetical protein